jgi:membrane-anchored mycosin MYCP
MRRTAAAAVVVAAVLLVPAPAYARPAACEHPPAPGTTISAVPYEDQMYGPARLAPLATGAGVRIAVIDSGVDAANPQLHGRVVAGKDFLRGDSDGRQDCAGHGTGVAGIIAAGPAAGVPFRGLAPDATIVPVRVSEQEEIGGRATGDSGTPRKLAQAVRWAATDGHARIINLSLTTPVDNGDVREAVADAISRGVVVVAAVGNNAQDGNPTPYPAAYPGVIGVGATGMDGVRAGFSQHGSYVDLAAAGDRVTATAPRSGQVALSGTSFAAPYVAATAALILQRFPGLGPEQVARRLTATADPAPGGQRSDEYGYGLLNPYRALTETLAPYAAARPVPAAAPTADPAAAARDARRGHARRMSLILAAAGAGGAVLVFAGAAVLRRGRRRGWRPA